VEGEKEEGQKRAASGTWSE